MIRQRAPDRPETAPAALAGAEAEDGAWYLYGITRPGASDAHLVDRDAVDRYRPPDIGTGTIEPVVALRCGELAAVVRRVRRADFSPEALRERLADPSVLEATARHHHAVVAAIHETQAILPVRFGCVYTSADELMAGLSSTHASLVDQLGRCDGCDEWAIHLGADADAARRRALDEDADARRVQTELASAGPGRAYFLGRKLHEIVAAAARRFLEEAAEGVYDQLARSSVDGLVTPSPRPADQAASGVEVLRAAFLVRRDERDAFLDAVRRVARGPLGLDCRSSGPWPPYSFATVVGNRP